MNLKTYYKQPSETLDYTLDYNEWLAKNDHIVSSVVVSVPPNLTISKISSERGITIFAGGGDNNTLYKITTTITTYNGLVKENEFSIRIREE